MNCELLIMMKISLKIHKENSEKALKISVSGFTIKIEREET